MNEINDERNLTKEEKKWTKKILKCLNEIPETIEICVTYSGTIEVMNRGASERYMNKFGDLDNPPIIITLFPKTANQIDGRDSML